MEHNARQEKRFTMTLRQELRPMLATALPLVAAEVGWMVMGVVDTAMVGRLPHAADAIGAGALAQIVFSVLAFGVGGVLLGLDTMIAQAHGAGRVAEANRWLLHGLYLAAAISVLLMGLCAAVPFGMQRLPVNPVVLAGAFGTLRALAAGILPLLVYFTVRRYLQAFNHGRWIAIGLVTANVVNVLADWLLIFPHTWRLGSSSHARTVAWQGMGVVGSGWATSIARLYMGIFLLAAVWWVSRRHNYGLAQTPLATEWQMLRRLLVLGLPAGAMIFVEIMVFTIVTMLCALLGPVPLAAHEIAYTCSSFTYMVTMGFSAAASVRVGQALGRGDPAGARRAGWTAVLLSGTFMLSAALLFWFAPSTVARLYTPNRTIIAAVLPLLALSAVFQFFDGVQVTAIGALRGAGDTHSGLITHLASYWLIGLPLGYLLAFHFHMGARGLWTGLCLSLIVTGSVMLARWNWMGRRLAIRG
jgi:MATE family multidrug resistance protein